MGYEKFEREFPCPCGKGVQVAEWEEHDTWVSANAGASYSLKCPDCAARLVYFSDGALHWVRREDKEKMDKLTQEARELRAQAEKRIVERYEQAFVDHVMRLPNRMAKKAATGAGRGFLQRAKADPSCVEATAHEAIKHHPQFCFAELKTPDAEIENLFADSERLKQEERALAASMEKIPIPDKRFGFKAFSAV